MKEQTDEYEREQQFLESNNAFLYTNGNVPLD